jgi:CHAT domain-containing protein
LLLLTCALAFAAGQPFHLKAVTGAGVESAVDADTQCGLTPGASITETISGGDSRTCEIQLTARQYLQVLIDKGDLNLALILYGPGGEKLSESVARHYGEVELSLVAESTGTYRLEIRSLEKDAAGKSYAVRIAEQRSATTPDVKDSSALKRFDAANNLRAEGDEAAQRKALEEFGQARLMWLSANQPRKAIKALTGAAEVHFALSEYRLALDLYQKARAESQLLSEPRAEFESANQIGRIYSYLGDNAKAEQYLTGVLRHYEQDNDARQAAPDKRLHAEALTNMGEVAYSKGDLVRALEILNRSLALWLEVDDRSGEAQTRLNLGYALTYSEDTQKALSQFNRARELYQLIGDRKGEALAGTALGTLHSLSGEEQLALASHLEAMNTFRRMGDRQSEAVTLNGVGQAYEDLNEKLTALDYYQQALALFESNESFDFAAGTEYEIARLYRLLNDNPAAFAHYNRCIELSRRAKKRRTEAYALDDLAAIYDAQGRTRETLDQYHKILKLYRQLGDLRGQGLALMNIGNFFFAAGEKQKALGYYKDSLPLTQASGDKIGETNTLYNIAHAARDCGTLDYALSEIEQSLQIIETLRTYVSSPSLRSSYFASVYKHYGLYIDLLMQLDKQRPGQGFAALALRASESARARSLLEILSADKVNIRQGVDQELLERERHLEQMLNAKAQYRITLSGSKQTRAEAAEVERDIRQLATEYQVVQAQLRTQNPHYAALTHQKILNLEEIQSALRDENTLLLEYFMGEDRSYLWVVSADSLSSYELPARATLEDAAREVYELLTTRQDTGENIDAAYQARVATADRLYAEKGLALSRMLLGPSASQLGDKRLLIVTEGVLQYIPFEALPDPEPPATPATAEAVAGAGNLPLLVSRHEIVSLPSMSTLATIRSESSTLASAPRVVAMLADPVFEKDDPRVSKSGDLVASTAPAREQPVATQRALKYFDGLTGSSHISRLPYTSQETDSILSMTPSDERMVATGFEASRETVLNSQLSQYQVVHFATHGLINNEHPELSGILLSLVNESGEPEDGFLQLPDIYNLRLSATLVVLSACNTGLGKDVRGEGLVGLTRGFMYAGSKGVIASLWKVDDRATAELMGYFYKALLKDKLPPAAALRSAKETLRRQPAWHAPYYWAAFVLQGEYKDRVQMTDPRRKFPYLIITSSAALLGLLCLLYFKRRISTGTHAR